MILEPFQSNTFEWSSTLFREIELNLAKNDYYPSKNHFRVKIKINQNQLQMMVAINKIIRTIFLDWSLLMIFVNVHFLNGPNEFH